VAGAIAEALNAKLSGAEREVVSSKPTENVAAYEAYLRGRSANLAGAGYESGRQAIAAFTEAARLDPKFSDAWAQLAINMGYLYFNNVDRDRYTAQSIKLAVDTAFDCSRNPAWRSSRRGHICIACRGISPARESLRGDPEARSEQRTRVADARVRGAQAGPLGGIARAPPAGHRARSAQRRLLTAVGLKRWCNIASLRRGPPVAGPRLAVSPSDTWALATRPAPTGRRPAGGGGARARVESGEPAGSGHGVLPLYQRLLERHFTEAIAEIVPILAQPKARSTAMVRSFVWSGRAQRAAGREGEAQTTFERLIAQIEPKPSRSTTLSCRDLGGWPTPRRQARRRAQAGQRAVELFGNDAIQGPLARQPWRRFKCSAAR
jgi:hypothetical protein